MGRVILVHLSTFPKEIGVEVKWSEYRKEPKGGGTKEKKIYFRNLGYELPLF